MVDEYLINELSQQRIFVPFNKEEVKRIHISRRARSQKILLGSAFEEKVDLLIVQYSPGAVAEFIIVLCMLIAHIHEGLYRNFINSALYFMCPS